MNFYYLWQYLSKMSNVAPALAYVNPSPESTDALYQLLFGFWLHFSPHKLIPERQIITASSADT